MNRLCLLTIGLAIALFHAAITTEPLIRIASMLDLGLLLVGCAWLELRQRRASAALGPPEVATILALAVAPYLTEPLERSLLGSGDPVELLVAHGLRNLMCALAALRRHDACQALALIASLALVLFSVVGSPTGPIVMTLAALYTGSASLWLIARDWERGNTCAAQSFRRQMPVRGTAAALGGILTLAITALWGTSDFQAGAAWAGFFPSSGGAGNFDPFARSGANDGDQLIAAKQNAASFGPVSSDLFLESEEPSLYDLFSDLYEEPQKRPKQTKKAISLPMRDVPQNGDRRIAESQTAEREFSTVRLPRDHRRPELEDRLSAAILQTDRRGPDHLRVQTFNAWDGRAWHFVGRATGETPRLVEAEGVPWIQFASPPPPQWSPLRHACSLRFLNYGDNRIPLPPQATRLHVDELRREDMLCRQDDGQLAMDLDRIPRLTVMQLESQLIGVDLANIDFTRESYVDWSPEVAAQLSAGSASVDARTVSLAREWAGNTPFGWPQITAIRDRLRAHARLDADARPTADCQDAVADFLFDRRAGPDYQFASAAVVLLRSLGYHARLASGFYVDPTRYDRETRLSSILGNDVHFWAEASPNGLDWIVVEATPGYDTPEVPLAFAERLRRLAGAIVHRLWSARVWVLAGTVFAVIGFHRRRPLMASWILLRWRAALWIWPASSVRATLRALESLTSLTGRRRPAHRPLASWYPADGQCGEFLGLCQANLYGALPPTASASHVRGVCHALIAWARTTGSRAVPCGQATSDLPGAAFR